MSNKYLIIKFFEFIYNLKSSSFVLVTQTSSKYESELKVINLTIIYSTRKIKFIKYYIKIFYYFIDVH